MTCWLGAAPAAAEERETADDGSAAALAARGERALLAGDAAAAGRLLDAAERRDPDYPWTYAYRAACRYQAGDFDGARRDAEALARLRPEGAAGPAILGLLAARAGDAEEALRRLDQAVAREGSPWARALRGSLLGRFGRLEEARADLDAALAREPSPWALGERADVLNRLGFFWLALEDLERVRAALPGEAEADVRAAAIHLDQAQYAAAAAKLGRALKRRPDDAQLYRRRSEVYFVKGDAAAALADGARACELAPGDPDLRLRLVRLLLLNDRYAEAERQIASPSLSPAAREYCLGYLRCRQRRFEKSAAHFARVPRVARAGDEHFAAKASLYRLVARTLAEAPAPRARRGKELLIVGLGYRQPFQISRQAIHALATRQRFYSNLSDAAVVDFLGLFPIPLEAIVFRRADQDAIKCARDVMPGFSTLDRAAMVTRGHPLYYGRLAYRLTCMSRRRGIAVRCLGSVSIADVLPSLWPEHARGSSLGVQIRNSNELDGVDPRLPLLLYNFSAAGEWRRALSERLVALYSSGHPCATLAGSGDREFSPRIVTLERLGDALEHADEAVTLLIPPGVPA